jgi:hypothetical protein
LNGDWRTTVSDNTAAAYSRAAAHRLQQTTVDGRRERGGGKVRSQRKQGKHLLDKIGTR